MGISFAIIFSILIACTIFIGYFINYGLLIIYVILGLLGTILTFYVLLEIIIKFIFNMKQNPKKLFIMFIIATLIIGISGSLFASELTTYTILDNPKYTNIVYKEEVAMQNNLIITSLFSSDKEVVFEERNNILIELYGTEYNISPIYTYNDEIYCRENYLSESQTYQKYSYYNYYEYLNGNTFNGLLKNILSMIKDKKIVTRDYLFYVGAKIYISKENFETLKNNAVKCRYYSYNELYNE